MAVTAAEQEFLLWLEGWLATRPLFDWPEASRSAVLVIDLVLGFCHQGPLASPRIAKLVEPTRQFLLQAQDRGLEQVYFCCDEHPPDSPEFRAFPPHCLQGSDESRLHPRLEELRWGRRIPKGSLSALQDTPLLAELLQQPQLKHFILVGDCSDLCVLHTAMQLRMVANARGLDWEVIVLADLVDTFDLPLEVAQSLGALPHPGDLWHKLALYQLALNGCRVERYSSMSA